MLVNEFIWSLQESSISQLVIFTGLNTCRPTNTSKSITKLHKLHKLSLLKQHIKVIGGLSQKNAICKAVSGDLRTKLHHREMQTQGKPGQLHCWHLVERRSGGRMEPMSSPEHCLGDI